jgi:catechol 2,3-dioxygenase-like lactoylglutathione lyase family enzyme
VASVLGFHHVQLAMPADREEDARRFYGGILGLEEVPKPGHLRTRGGCWFRGGDAELHLGTEEGFRPARKAHPALLVDDLDVIRDRLAAVGHEIILDAELAGHRRVYTADPFGNRIELIATA